MKVLFLFLLALVACADAGDYDFEIAIDQEVDLRCSGELMLLSFKGTYTMNEEMRRLSDVLPEIEFYHKFTIDDGYGGKEVNVICNAYPYEEATTNSDAYDRMNCQTEYNYIKSFWLKTDMDDIVDKSRQPTGEYVQVIAGQGEAGLTYTIDSYCNSSYLKVGLLVLLAFLL